MSNNVILDVFKRASGNRRFWTHSGDADAPSALEGYLSSSKAKAARSSGNPHWIKTHVVNPGMILVTWRNCRSQQEN